MGLPPPNTATVEIPSRLARSWGGVQNVLAFVGSKLMQIKSIRTAIQSPIADPFSVDICSLVRFHQVRET